MVQYGTTRRRVLGLAGGVAVALAGGAGVASAHGASVTFDDQEATGAAVNIAETTLSHGGWIVLHEEQADGSPGRVIGHSGSLDAGTHTDVTVAIQRGKVPKDARRTDRTLVAMAHKDTGEEGEFEFPAADPPYTAGGAPVIDKAFVTF